jgi:uncharacterized RmlC-like cupin family protein
MSISVPLSELPAALEEFDGGYLLTTTGERVKAVHVRPVLRDGVLLVRSPGGGSLANARSNPAVTLLWPSLQPGGPSLLVDGTAEVDGETLHVRPASGVLHVQQHAPAAPRPVRVFRGADLAPADPTPGMARSRAFELPRLWAGRVETAPGAVSGWHHHDLNETSLYVVAGVLRVECEGVEGYQDAGVGDFVHVPAFTVHRESNPTSEPSVAVIARSGGGVPTVNVDGPQSR